MRKFCGLFLCAQKYIYEIKLCNIYIESDWILQITSLCLRRYWKGMVIIMEEKEFMTGNIVFGLLVLIAIAAAVWVLWVENGNSKK